MANSLVHHLESDPLQRVTLSGSWYKEFTGGQRADEGQAVVESAPRMPSRSAPSSSGFSSTCRKPEHSALLRTALLTFRNQNGGQTHGSLSQAGDQLPDRVRLPQTWYSR